MKNKKTKKIISVYGVLGKSLTACAGGIVGFTLGGPLLALVGVFLGSIAGHFIEKSVVSI